MPGEQKGERERGSVTKKQGQDEEKGKDFSWNRSCQVKEEQPEKT